MKIKNLLPYFFALIVPFICFSDNNPVDTVPSIVLPENTNVTTASNNITNPIDPTSTSNEDPLDIPEIEDIRPEVDLPTELWKIITLTSIILLAIICLILWLKKRKQQKTLPIIPIDPYQQALKSLDDALQHVQQLDPRPFAFGVTDAIRQYLSSVFKLPAPEYTTDEVFKKLPSIHIIPQNLQQDIIHLLQQCDLAKFTQQTLEQPQRLELYNLAKNILTSADKIIQLQAERTKTIQ